MRRRRTYSVVQTLLAIVLLTAPRSAASIVARRHRPAPAWLVRLLGARLLLQGWVLARRPTAAVVAAESGLEAVHGVTMLGLAHLVPTSRRTALSAAALAGGLVLSGLVAYP